MRKTRLYEDVVVQIHQLIRKRELTPGDRLPPERELAATLGIGRPSVRESLAFLLDVKEDTLLELWEVRQGLEEQIARLRDHTEALAVSRNGGIPRV